MAGLRGINQSQEGSTLKSVSLIFAVGIATRLLALPWAETVNGDAVSRTYLAWAWANHPHWISADIWLPLSTYVMGISLWLFPWPFWTPIGLNILLISATAVCLWAWTRQAFVPQGRGTIAPSNSASCFVAIAFLLMPLAFRTSLMALSEPLYVLLLGLVLLCLGQARRWSADTAGSWVWAIVAGASMTLATAVRYEAWALVPAMALLLGHRPRALLIFGLVAAVFPLYWLASSYAQHGDALAMLKLQSIDTAQVLAEHGGMTWIKRWVRLAFFPLTLIFGMTVGVLGLSLRGIWLSRRQSPHCLIWLLPFGVLLGLLVYKAVTGTLNLETRYSLALTLFLLPYGAIGIQGLGRSWRQILLVSILPLGYLLYGVTPLSNGILQGISRSPALYNAPIPRITATSRSLVGFLARDRHHEAVMVLGFDNNQVAQQILYHNRLAPTAQLTVPRRSLLPQRQRELERAFFENHPTGLLLAERSRLPPGLRSQTTPVLFSISGHSLQLTWVGREGEAILYRYRHLAHRPADHPQ